MLRAVSSSKGLYGLVINKQVQQATVHDVAQVELTLRDVSDGCHVRSLFVDFCQNVTISMKMSLFTIFP